MSIEIDYTYGTLESTFLETLGDISGSATLDLTSGNVFSYTPTADTTFTFSNAPTNYSMLLKIKGIRNQVAFDTSTLEPISPYNGMLFEEGNSGSGNLDGIAINTDGTKLLTLESGRVFSWTLSTGWDLSTATKDSVTPLVVSGSSHYALGALEDGSKIYVLSNGNDTVYQYDLSTPWDITTGTANGSKSVTTEVSNPRAMFVFPDGSGFIVGGFQSTIHQYSMSNGNVSGASTSVTLTPSSNPTIKEGLLITDNGTKLYMTGNVEYIRQFSLSTPYNISTASYVGLVSMSQVGPARNTFGMVMNPSGTRMLISTDSFGSMVWELNLSTAWDITTATWPGTQTGSGTFRNNTTRYTPLGFEISQDGTKVYMSVGNTAYQYALSTEFDVNTMGTTPTGSIGVTNAETLVWKPDGTKWYGYDRSNDVIRQWTANTNWDIANSTAGTVSASLAAKDGNMFGMAFKSDGTKVYLGGYSNVYQYSLTTPWDTSTLVDDNVSFQTSANGGPVNGTGLVFSSDGTKMFRSGAAYRRVGMFTLSIAWDLSTASQTAVTVLSINDYISDIKFNADGTKLFATDEYTRLVNTYDYIEEYSYTYPSSVMWEGGTVPTAPLNDEINILSFSTTDGGTTWYGYKLGDAMS